MSEADNEGGRLKWIPLVLVPLLVALVSSPVWSDPICRLIRLCDDTNAGSSSPGPSHTDAYFVGTLRDVGDVSDIAFDHDGKLLATAGGNSHTVALWNTSTGERVRLLAANGVVAAVAFSTDGKVLAGGDLYDSATGEHLRSVGGGYDVEFSPDGTLVATANGFQPNGVRLYSTTTGEVVRVFTSEYANALAFSPDGKILATTTGYRNKGVELWNVGTGELLRTLSGGSTAVAFSPNGKFLATSGDGKIRLWDPSSGEQRREIDASVVLGFSRDGKLAATGSDKAVRLYDPATGNPLVTLPNVYADDLTFSPDGKRVAVVSPDHTVQIVPIP